MPVARKLEDLEISVERRSWIRTSISYFLCNGNLKEFFKYLKIGRLLVGNKEMGRGGRKHVRSELINKIQAAYAQM